MTPTDPPPPARKRKLLALSDVPSLTTGFATVARELFPRWHESGFFDEIWCFGIGYQGYPLTQWPWLKAIPAGTRGEPVWWAESNLQRFVNQASRQDGDGCYTHVWAMHDPFSLRPLAEPFFEMRKEPRCPATVGYFPVDAPLRPDWVKIAEACDVPVAYTEQGRREMVSAFTRKLDSLHVEAKEIAKQAQAFRDRIEVIPHGVDTSTYYPMSEESRQAARQRLWPKLTPEKFLIVNVNGHQRRKGLFQTLEIFAFLQRYHPEIDWQLYLHMPQSNASEGTDLWAQAETLGIRHDSILFGDNFFKAGAAASSASTAKLNEIYNAADLFLTTTHGEGWGLTVTEAMASGRPVAAPFHTSLGEILDPSCAIALPVMNHVVLPGDRDRPRPVVDAATSADLIYEAVKADRLRGLGFAGRDKMLASTYDWNQIAQRWLDLFARCERPVPRAELAASD